MSNRRLLDDVRRIHTGHHRRYGSPRVTDQVKRYGREMETEEVRGPTLHGLRGTAVVIRRRAGYEIRAISNDIGMSIQMVAHYTHFMDQTDAAETNRRRFEVLVN